MLFVLYKPRRGSLLTSEMTFCYMHGNRRLWAEAIAIMKPLAKIWINPWEGVMQDSDIWSVIWMGYIFLLQ